MISASPRSASFAPLREFLRDLFVFMAEITGKITADFARRAASVIRQVERTPGTLPPVPPANRRQQLAYLGKCSEAIGKTAAARGKFKVWYPSDPTDDDSDLVISDPVEEYTCYGALLPSGTSIQVGDMIAVLYVYGRYYALTDENCPI